MLEPAIEGFFQLMANVGLMRAGGGYSGIETLAVRGHPQAAAEAYAERARNPAERVEATLRRASLLGISATAIGEYELGLNAVAAPIHDARGNVIAAVDVWGPAFRLTPRRIPELAAQAREAAAAISVRLGGTAPVRQPIPVTATA